MSRPSTLGRLRARLADQTIGSVVAFSRTVYTVEHMKHLNGGIIIE